MSRPGRIKPITGINQAIPTPTMDMSLAKMQGGSAGYVAEAADVTGGAAAAGGAGISPAMYMEPQFLQSHNSIDNRKTHQQKDFASIPTDNLCEA